eukprot:TRINITY_DN31037_c0_g1_i1.p2 TRINITY_DN31037_c0_g1~~TRINITY_DN31037_c0_g1_i1.p2  ORF type:complete len:321 (-),score=49.12 TRINITY_DN31037_c0_g1_i1:57-986(-)
MHPVFVRCRSNARCLDATRIAGHGWCGRRCSWSTFRGMSTGTSGGGTGPVSATTTADRRGGDEDLWFITAETNVASLAGALLSRITEPSSTTVKMPVVEAMGSAAVSRALHGLARANRLLEGGGGAGTRENSEAHPRLAFAPVLRMFVLREGEKVFEENPTVRQSLRLQVSTLSVRSRPELLGAPLQDGGADDRLIKVGSRTDVQRLGGLVASRWSRLAFDRPRRRDAGAAAALAPPPLAVQAMGATSINNMVRALAVAWQRCARPIDIGDDEEEDEEELHRAGFVCMPIPLGPPGDVSGVECKLVLLR